VGANGTVGRVTGKVRRWRAPELSGQQASLVAIGFVVVVAVADSLRHGSALLGALAVLAPFLVAAYGTPGQTLAVAVAAFGGATAASVSDDFFITGDRLAIMSVVALAGAAAVWLADRRLRRENELARERPAAELGRRLELALVAGRMGTWSWDMASGHVEWDDACSALFGLARKDFVGTFDAWVAMLHPDDRDAAVAEVYDAVEARSGFRFDHRCVWADGSVHWLEGAGEVVLGGDGQVVGATGVVIDIDARVRSEEAERAAREASERSAMQLDELRRAERETRERLDVIMRTAPVGLAFVDTHLCYAIVNEKLAEINGLAVEDHLGRRVADVVPDLAEVNEELLRRVLETDAPITDVELQGETSARPGERRDWLVCYYPVDDAAGNVIGVGMTVVEITERRHAEEAVWESATRAAMLLELSQSLAVAGDTETVTEVILTRALPSVGARGGLAIVERQAGVLRNVGITGYPQGELENWQTVPLDAPTPISDAARDGHPRYVESASHLAREYPHLARVRAATGDEAFVALPLKASAGDSNGVLMVAYPHARTFSPDERMFLETLATICGQALGRAQLTELEHALQLLSALDSMLDAVAIDSAVRDEHGRIVDFRIEYMNAARAAAAGQSAGQLIGKSLLEVAPDMKGSELFDGYARVVETGEPLRLDAVPYEQLVGGRDDGTGTYAVQVTRFGDGLIVAARDVTEQERALAALRESEARLAQAQRIAHLGSWEWDAATNSVTWSDEMYRIYGRERGAELHTLDQAIALCSPESREAVRRELLESMRDGGAVTFEQKLVRDSGEVRVTIVNAEPFHDEAGTLIALRGTTQDVTEQRAAQEALFHAATELEREQELLEALQRAILPHELPEVDGVALSAHYLPASMDVEIGGDWYDAFVLPDGRLCLSVGDVAGHGIQSAATMGQLRNAFRAYAHAGFGPAQTLGHLDQLLYTSGESDWSCATCLFVEYTPSTRRLRWARAGHPHPLLHGRGALELVGAGGPPLGAGIPEYDEADVTLTPGDVLFLYTDGLIERPGEILDVGIERLLRTIESLDPDDDFNLYATRVCTEVLADRPRRDDVCVLALRVADQASG